MQRSEILKKIMLVINEQTDIPTEEMSEESLLIDDLDLSSLEVYGMLSELEKAFSVRIPSREVRGFASVGDMADCIERLR